MCFYENMVYRESSVKIVRYIFVIYLVIQISTSFKIIRCIVFKQDFLTYDKIEELMRLEVSDIQKFG